jgi:hypothetical protein
MTSRDSTLVWLATFSGTSISCLPIFMAGFIAEPIERNRHEECGSRKPTEGNDRSESVS